MNLPPIDAGLRVRRLLDAPRERVFHAWTDPAVIARWWGPPEAAVVIELDLQVGGSYRYTVTEQNGHIWYLVGRYLEVTPPVRLVYSWVFENTQAPLGPDTLVTVDFVDRGTQTEVIVTHERFTTNESRQAHLDGWEMCLDRMQPLL